MGLNRNLYLTFCLLLLQLARYECNMSGEYGSHERGIRSPKEINDYIYGFNYDRDKVLASQGEKVTGKPTEGSLDGSKNFIVIAREKKSIENHHADIGVLSSNEHRTYPGALLLANQRLLDNQPDYVSIERAPITYTMNLPGMKEGEGSFTVVPTYDKYKAAHDKTLNTWFEKYSKSHDIIAQMQYDRTFAYSQEQLRVAFGVEFKYSSVEANVDFKSVSEQKKTVMIFRFKQVFYTVSTQTPHKPSDYFGSKVSVQDVKQKMNNNNPPVLVDSVSYGRVIYVQISSSSASNEVKAALETKLTSFDVSSNVETEIKKVCENLSMNVYVMGGGSQHVELINAKSFKEVNDAIIKYRKLGPKNLGYPMSYSTEFIKDNSRAVVKAATDYVETTRTIYKSGIIKLEHKGGYVAQFTVNWDEITYDKNGQIITSRKGWKKNWDSVTAPFSTEIQLSGNSRNIAVYARGCTGLAWEWWRTTFDRKGISLINYRTFSIWGTTLNQKYSISPPLLIFGVDGGNSGNGIPILRSGDNLFKPADVFNRVADAASGLVRNVTDFLHPQGSKYQNDYNSMYPNYQYHQNNYPAGGNSYPNNRYYENKPYQPNNNDDSSNESNNYNEHSSNKYSRDVGNKKAYHTGSFTMIL